MKNIAAATIAIGLILFSIPNWSNAADTDASSGAASLLNKANQMNNEEEDMANLLHKKAGDNQALTTLSDTLKADHKANQAAAEALAHQKNIKLDSYTKDKATYDRLSDLSGASFNNAFFTAAIKDHRQAISTFEEAKGTAADRDMKIYIDQTIPVLQSHLRMVENLKRDSAAGSPENPANNRAESSNH